MDFILFLLLLYAVFILPIHKKYKHSTYGKVSGNSFIRTLVNAGMYGEFLLFSKLEKVHPSVKLLTNVYIPKGNGKTTEIDLVMLSEIGIHVFESKNYSGWIYGKESQRYWTQTFPNKKKYKLYNPIWQNNGHITALVKFLNLDKKLFYSVIVFGEKATIKTTELFHSQTPILYRRKVDAFMREEFSTIPKILTDCEIEALYQQLLPHTKVDETMKKEHIERISKPQT